MELFSRYPHLEQKLPREALGNLPTPLQQLNNLSEILGRDIYIKRDDLSHPVYGGNKVRKLEFVLADVKRKKKETVVTIGGIGSHHIAATAALCRERGIKTTGLFFCQPVTDHVRSNLLLDYEFGAKMSFVKDYAGVARGYLEEYFYNIKNERKAPYLLVPGGSTALSGLGYLNAVLELQKQLADRGLPDPEAIFVPAGSGGTMAGLLAGISLANMNTILYGIRVVPRKILSPKRVLALACGTLIYLSAKGVKTARAYHKLLQNKFMLIGDYLGDGYGFCTPEAEAAINIFQEKERITLEGCYTGKAAAGLIDYCRVTSGVGKRPLIFFNTYSSTHENLLKNANKNLYKKLPKEFHWCFEKEPVKCSCGLKKGNRNFCDNYP